MIKAPIAENEIKRLEILKSKNLLDSDPDPKFDAVTAAAVKKLNVPISTVSVIDENREWYKSCIGTENKEGPREISFCGHALVDTEMLICKDTLEDERFKDNPYVINPPYIRFYAGMKLLDKKSGLPMAVFCIKDTKPRILSMDEIGTFVELGMEAEKLIN